MSLHCAHYTTLMVSRTCALGSLRPRIAIHNQNGFWDSHHKCGVVVAVRGARSPRRHFDSKLLSVAQTSAHQTKWFHKERRIYLLQKWRFCSVFTVRSLHTDSLLTSATGLRRLSGVTVKQVSHTTFKCIRQPRSWTVAGSANSFIVVNPPQQRYHYQSSATVWERGCSVEALMVMWPPLWLWLSEAHTVSEFGPLLSEVRG